MSAEDEKPIIIKKIKKGGHGHHGGAWKVAYADFVTAMMAFFLLLWLLNVTTDEQKELISSYFDPAHPSISESTSGAGGVLAGQTMADAGALASKYDPVSDVPLTPTEDEGFEVKARADEEKDISALPDDALKEELERRDQERFDKLTDELKQAIEESPELKEFKENLLIDQTPEGLRIQIIDQKGRPMFPLGSATPLPITVKLLQVVTRVVMKAPNRISVRGHTDARPYGPEATYTNWELSADRANASRRIMLANKLNPKRIENVVGRAARSPLLIKDPYSPQNRRISIILLKESIVRGIYKKKEKPKETPEQKKKRIEAIKKQKEKELYSPKVKKREEGVIYFP